MKRLFAKLVFVGLLVMLFNLLYTQVTTYYFRNTGHTTKIWHTKSRSFIRKGDSVQRNPDAWSPYMDALDVTTALKDDPLFDIRNSVSLNLSSAFIVGRQQKFAAGDMIRIHVDLYDGYGQKRKVGKDGLHVRIFNDKLGAAASGYILDHDNGSYTALVKCFWSGEASVEVQLSYPRELIRAKHNEIRQIISYRTYSVTYKNGQNKTCFGLVTPLLGTRACNMTHQNGGMSWFCGAPDNDGVTCDDWDYFSKNYSYRERVMTGPEVKLFRYYGSVKRSLSMFSINVAEKYENPESNVKPPCSMYNRTMLWFLPSPVGYFYDSKWRTDHCTPPSVDSFGACLRDKYLILYGDSTVRQWFVDIYNRFGCELLTEKWTYDKWVDESIAHCSSLNLILEWIPHELPGNTRPRHRVKHSVAGHMLENMNKTNVIFLIHMYGHLRSVHPDVFRQRVAAIRHSIEKVSEVNKNAIFMIKAAPTDRGSVDFIAYLHRTFLIEEFRGSYEKVIYLDNKDITIAKNIFGLHPKSDVVREMVNQMFYYLC